ncbi:MAG: STM4504/CBY_0614 family protein [Vitreoscilla sp.]
MHDKAYAGAEAEFRKAHEHYRSGHNKECLAECLKTIESTIKVIAKKRKWAHPPNDTAQPLIKLMFDKGLIPQFWATHFGGLRSMLESGVPTGRNRLGGHGQGGTVTQVPASIAGFAIHQTAAAVVFLARADKELP